MTITLTPEQAEAIRNALYSRVNAIVAALGPMQREASKRESAALRECGDALTAPLYEIINMIDAAPAGKDGADAPTDPSPPTPAPGARYNARHPDERR